MKIGSVWVGVSVLKTIGISCNPKLFSLSRWWGHCWHSHLTVSESGDLIVWQRPCICWICILISYNLVSLYKIHYNVMKGKIIESLRQAAHYACPAEAPDMGCAGCFLSWSIMVLLFLFSCPHFVATILRNIQWTGFEASCLHSHF
jgi:hypothetical protein